jgi:capsular polysaccharide transport system permease protein
LKRWIRYLTARRLAVWLVLAPTLLSGAYLYFLAADRYVSESALTVKQSGEQAIGAAGDLAGLASIFQVTGVNSRSDLTLLQTYIGSVDMLQILEAKLHLRDAFSAPRRDVLLRLSTNASQEDFLEYYRARVEARFDDTNGLLILRTQGFTPEQAQAINKTIVDACEEFINRISQRLAQEQTAFAAKELGTAIARYRSAKDKMFTFQERHHVLDPTAQAEANTAITTELQARLSRLEADLRAMSSYMSENSFQIRTLREQIDAARDQIAAEATRGTKNTVTGTRLNSLAADFRELQIEVDFAEQAYKSAAVSMETARLESTRKIKTLVMVASPPKPQDPAYPRRAYDLLALALGFALLFGVARLLIATIEDHLD